MLKTGPYYLWMTNRTFWPSARYIRNELGNRLTPLIIRTGQAAKQRLQEGVLPLRIRDIPANCQKFLALTFGRAPNRFELGKKACLEK